jgi:hypothetical protein
MPDLHSLQTSPYYYLILGIILFSLGVLWTCIGKARARFGGWVYRAQEPTQFWLVVAVYYLGGVIFIGYFLYKVHAPSN